MIEEVLANSQFADRVREASAPVAGFRREWENAQKVEHLQAELKIERLRLGEDPSMNDVWRGLPV